MLALQSGDDQTYSNRARHPAPFPLSASNNFSSHQDRRMLAAYFLKKVKSDSVRFGGIFLNIGVGSWLLTPELVTGEAEDLQTRFSVLAGS